MTYSLCHCERPTGAWQSIGIVENGNAKLFDVFQIALFLKKFTA
jgi:hypothetical protein